MSIDIEVLDGAIGRQHEAQPFSGVVCVREHGKTVFEQAYGFANKADALPNKIDTKFAVASGSKTFTAAAICQLVERGLLTFETRLKDCLTVDFPLFDPALTVQHLLSHTSGIPDYFDEDVMDDYAALWTDLPVYKIRTPSDFLPLFQHLPMKFSPGERFTYNNSGYIVLGLIVEQISGMAFPDYVKTHIFDVCGMVGSGYYASDALPTNTALGYIPDGAGGWRTNIYAVPIIGGADGGVFTTAPDMCRYWDALRAYRVVGEAMTRLMLTPQATAQDEGYAYGYGVHLRTRDGRVIRYNAEGEDPGAAFLSGVFPDRDADFTVLGNTVDATWPVVKLVLKALE